MVMTSRTVIRVVLALVLTSVPVASSNANPSQSASTGEGVLVNWPDEEGWTIADRQENQKLLMIELLRKGESLDNWTQIGTMISGKGVRLADIRMAYERYAATFKKTCPDVRLAIHVIEPTIEFPRVIFSQECSKTPKDGHPEAAVWLVVQGRQSLYTVHRALRAEALSDELRAKWVEWLKTARVVQR